MKYLQVGDWIGSPPLLAPLAHHATHLVWVFIRIYWIAEIDTMEYHFSGRWRRNMKYMFTCEQLRFDSFLQCKKKWSPARVFAPCTSRSQAKTMMTD